ncbi:hypothetical protein BH10PAT2_BH10PAT2_0050 [soil metagenome]
MKKKKSASQPVRTNKTEVIELYRKAMLSGVPLDLVHQKVITASEKAAIVADVQRQEQELLVNEFHQQIPRSTRIASKVLPPIFIVLGLFLVGSAVIPIASYFIFTMPDLKSGLIAPVPEAQVLDAMPKVVTQVKADNSYPSPVTGVLPKQTDPFTTQIAAANSNDTPADAPVISPTIDNTELDYTNLSNWFPNLALPTTNDTQQITEYRLDVPDVDIQNAVVNVGGSNLDKSLIQYPGTGNPGQAGTPVIFGHSVLRQFYNPSEKNPRRYLSIFSKIMTLKKGALIYVTQDNVRYTYSVRDRTVVQPEDTYILDQDYSQKTLKIVTCVPEGTFLQRGVITADLIKTE